MKKVCIASTAILLALSCGSLDNPFDARSKSYVGDEAARGYDTTQPPPVDTTATPPVDTTATPPVDTTATPPVDTTATPPVDTTATPPVDTTATPPVDTTTTPPVDTTTTPPVDTTATPPADTTTTPPATYTLTTAIDPLEGGSITLDPDQPSYNADTKVTATAIAAEGFIFVKWSGASTSTKATVTTTMNSNKKLTANFQRSGTTPPIDTTQPPPTIDTTQTPPTVDTTKTPPTVDTTKTPPVDTTKYTLLTAAAPTGGGTITRSPDQAAYKAGSQVTLTATAAADYTFSKWSGASTSTAATITITMNGNKEVTANFKVDGKTIEIEVIPPNGGTVTRSPDMAVYPTGSEVTLTATPAQHYTFVEWAGTGTGTAANRKNNSIVVTTANDRTLTATFSKNEYTLTTAAAPAAGGTITRSPDKTSYEAGTQVTVTATGAAGYTFTGWAGASTSTNTTVTVTMDGNKTLTANFKPPIIITEPEMIFVQGGTFTMGCTEKPDTDCESKEKPAHSVTLSNYYIGKYEVTRKLWMQVMADAPTRNSPCRTIDNLPAECISWDDINDEFIPRLNALTGKNYRLPTEAEWEYAARGGSNSKGYKYSGSNTYDNVAWHWFNSDQKTHEVGTKAPNELGIYDMSGNVWEWVSDWRDDYNAKAETNPTGPSTGSDRVVRGGSCLEEDDAGRVSHRYALPSNFLEINIGFRLARSAP